MSEKDAKFDHTETANPTVIAAAAAKAIQESFGSLNSTDAADREGAVTLVMHKVLIEKDPMTKIQSDIFDYELPILYAIYGEDMIHVVDEFTAEHQVANFDPDVAYDRLHEKYGKAGEEAIRQIYNQGAYSLAQEVGVKSERPRGAQRNRQKVTNLEIDHNTTSQAEIAKQEVRILPQQKASKVTKTAAPAKVSKAAEKGKQINATKKAAAKKAAKK